MSQFFTDLQNKILNELKQGKTPWISPFKNSYYGGFAKNFMTNKEYTGCNAFILNFFYNYESNIFSTYKQYAENGIQVQKGQKGIQISYPIIKKDQNGDIENIFFKVATVFNISQTDYVMKNNSDKLYVKPDIEKELSKINFNMEITKLGKASYRPACDKIVISDKNNFKNIDSYYSTLFHELIHWTGHESRLDRDLKSFTESQTDYALEELTAELGCAFLCKRFGINSELNNSIAYMSNWIQLLQNDSNAFKKACNHAQKAYSYIMEMMESDSIKMAA